MLLFSAPSWLWTSAWHVVCALFLLVVGGLLPACSVDAVSLADEENAWDRALPAEQNGLERRSFQAASVLAARFCPGDGGATALAQGAQLAAAGEAGRRLVSRSQLIEISINQGVEVGLATAENDTFAQQADVVAARDALVRVLVDPGDQVFSGARLTLTQASAGAEAAVVLAQEDVRALRRRSTKGDLASGYYFYVPGSMLTAATGLRVEVFREGPCELMEPAPDPARIPSEGFLDLSVREVGPLHMTLVPIAYHADGSGREPDFSAAHLQELREHLLALFPVSDVLFRIHDLVHTEQENLADILSELIHLRDVESPAAYRSYFGFVNPAESMDAYCDGSCVAGVSQVGSASGVASSGLGVGFRDAARETFLHELGHMHRLGHAPCGSPPDVDERFPDPKARLGTWGYDMRSDTLIDPGSAVRDFMSYCDPTWISAYNYQRLIERVSLSNGLIAR